MFLGVRRNKVIRDFAFVLALEVAAAGLLSSMLNHAALAQAAAAPAAPLTISPIERALPEAQPRAVPPLLPTPAPGAPEVPAGPPVTIQAVEIQGATAYKPGELEPYYSGIVGKSVPLGQISTVLQRFQTKYRNDGYVLTVVRGTAEPVGGRSTLRIRVVEGFISDVKIDGDIGPAGLLIYAVPN